MHSNTNKQTNELPQLRKDARWGIWLFLILNLLVAVLISFGGEFYEIVFVLLWVQAFLFALWLLPVFLYQLIIKKIAVNIALLKAFASYKHAMEHVSW